MEQILFWIFDELKIFVICVVYPFKIVLIVNNLPKKTLDLKNNYEQQRFETRSNTFQRNNQLFDSLIIPAVVRFHLPITINYWRPSIFSNIVTIDQPNSRQTIISPKQTLIWQKMFKNPRQLSRASRKNEQNRLLPPHKY